MTPKQQRAARLAQAKRRGTKASHKTEMENVLMILAWESEILSEGQVSKMLDLDRVSVRRMRLGMLDRAAALAESLDTRRPPASPSAGEPT